MMQYLFMIRAVVGWAFVLVLFTGAGAQEWTRFRGPNGQGIAQTDPQAIPTAWTASDYNWKIALPGGGHSSPVVWGDKVFLLCADPEDATRRLVCVSASQGKIAWVREYASKPHHLHARSSFASCTPAVDADAVYVAWATPDELTVLALDHDGNERWKKSLGPYMGEHGFGTSPILYKDLVILFNSQQSEQLDPGLEPGESSLVALDRHSGNERWHAPSVSTRVCYTVPCIYESASGKPELICCSTGDGMFSLDPETGTKNWSIDVFEMRTVSSPVIAGNLLIGTTGSGGGANILVAVRPGPKPELVYEIRRQAPYVPTPVVRGPLMFLFYDKGIVSCVNIADGQVHWRERLDTAFTGSPVLVGDRLFAIDDEGVVWVLAADDQFQVLAKNPLGEVSQSTPAVSHGHMYLRTYTHLISVGRGSTLSE